MSPWHCIITPWANWVAFLRSHEARGRNWIKQADLEKRAVMVEKIEIDWPRGGPTDAINSHSASSVTRTKAICEQSNTHTAYGWERDRWRRQTDERLRERERGTEPTVSPQSKVQLISVNWTVCVRKNKIKYWAVLLHHHVVTDIPASSQHSYKVWSIYC